MKSRIRLLIVALSLLLSVAACGVNRYYIVRHADRFEAEDSLTASGMARAGLLRDLLQNKHLTKIYSTDTRRTRRTATPISETLHLPVTIYSSDTLQQFVEHLKKLKGKNVLIVGHSNTVDDIANMLCGAQVVKGDLSFTEYDNIFFVQRKTGSHPSPIFKSIQYGPTTE